ncbi:retrovirus-related Pol polyprotein from transposon 17.6 [Trichonephila clavipes]|nr:retrovirus-related Pol polyprotein from transposon 17.6 [Trichonephila clavipes]
MIVQFRNEKDSNNGSIPITIDCNVVAFIVFEEGFHQPIKRTKQAGSYFRIVPEQYFSGVKNVVEFLENIDNNLTYYEIPAQLACAYLKGHLTGRALDWFEVLGYRVVEDKATDYSHLKQALSEQVPVVRNKSELETRFYSSSQKRNQKPSNFVYDLLMIHKILKLEMTEEKLIDHIISWLEPQILDYVEEYTGKLGETRCNNTYADNSRPRKEFNRFASHGVVDNRRFNGRRRGGQSDHRFHNQGGSRNSAFKDFDQKSLIIPDNQIKQLQKIDKPVEIDLSDTKLGDGQKQKLRNLWNGFKGLLSDQLGLTHVFYHEIDTRGKGPVVSRPYRYYRIKQGIIDYHIEKMLQECMIRPIQSPYASPVVLTRKNNGLPPNSREAYRFAIDYRKLNAITKYPRYPLPVIDDLITNIPHTGVMSTLDLKSGYFQLAISPKDIEKIAFITRNGTFAFLRMPFGLSGAAPNFQKVIDIILKPIIRRFATLNKAERSYAVTERECLAVIWALNKFKTYFGSLPVKALRALALNSREQLIREQRKDPELGHIYRYLENPDDGFVNATVCEDLLGSYPASRPERYRFLLVITDHFTKWSELIPLRKPSDQAVANAFFENYISRYGAPISLISDNCPQFISEVFEHLSHRLDIKHLKTVTYSPQANLTERVNRNLVQMIACFVEENHENWDRFLQEFAFALRISVNETTNKTPAELFLGRKIITPFSKLINVTEGAEYVGRNIEKLFDETRQNIRK